MSLFKVVVTSSCGTYFRGYLQSVTVRADTLTQAKTLVAVWLSEEGYKFVREVKDSDWEQLAEDSCGVVDYHYDSDY